MTIRMKRSEKGVIRPQKDYHWYRQDDDGSWSHKPGDYSVHIGITDPEKDANDRNYTTICGYLCMPDEGLDVDGGLRP